EDAANRMALPPGGPLPPHPQLRPRVAAAWQSPRPALTCALRPIAAPAPVRPRSPTTADRSVPRGRQLSAVFRHRQRVPQCHKPLAAERRSVQFLIRRDCNLALIECCRRLAAQPDPVIADDVDPHEWVLLIDPAAGCRR